MEKHVQQNTDSKHKAKTGITKKVKEDESFTDFLCPICLQILIEPVQMPCKHELCMDCFQKHVYSTSLTCPMCRFRISVWARKNTKANTLVHTERWNLIKKLFPERVKRRLDGLDDLDSSFDEYNAPVHIISSTGEVRKEYEEEVKKLQEESEKVMQANIEYIQKLQQQEHEEILRQEELDRITAQELQQQEMSYLGVKLKSPSAHQEKLLAFFKPKSPMRLRKREIGAYNSNLAKKKLFDLHSPKKKIKKYFQAAEVSDNFYTNHSHSDSKALESPFVLDCTKDKTEKLADNKRKKKIEYNIEDKLIDTFVFDSKQPLSDVSKNSCIIKSNVEILNNQIDLTIGEKTEAKTIERGLMGIAVKIEQSAKHSENVSN